jgi:hypothetical protein
MKTKLSYYLCSIVLLTIGLTGCAKEDIEPKRYYEFAGEAFALKNNKLWKAEISAIKPANRNTGFILSLYQYNKSGILLEGLTFDNLKATLDEQTLYTPNFYEETGIPEAYHYTIIDGDVIDDTYRVDESKYNYIKITRYDTVKATIEGNFEIHHLIQRDGRFTEGDPEVSFTSGEFVTKVNPDWFE